MQSMLHHRNKHFHTVIARLFCLWKWPWSCCKRAAFCRCLSSRRDVLRCCEEFSSPSFSLFSFLSFSWSAFTVQQGKPNPYGLLSYWIPPSSSPSRPHGSCP